MTRNLNVIIVGTYFTKNLYMRHTSCGVIQKIANLPSLQQLILSLDTIQHLLKRKKIKKSRIILAFINLIANKDLPSFTFHFEHAIRNHSKPKKTQPYEVKLPLKTDQYMLSYKNSLPWRLAVTEADFQR